MADFFKLSFTDPVAGLVNWGSPFGTELIFDARETTGPIRMNEPYRNEVFRTAEGYSGASPERIGRSWVVRVQLLDARTIAKLQHVQTAVRFGYYCSAVFISGYLLPNQTLNTLFDNSSSANIARAIIDVGEEQVIYEVDQAVGPVWKTIVDITVRESIAMTVPQSGTVIIATGPGGIGQ